MWGGSCHDPHEQPANARAYYRGRCLSCHGESLVRNHPKTATAAAKSPSAEGLEDCIGCHMPKRPASDGGHTAFTDHRIARFATRTPEVRTTREPIEGLMSWREPAGALAQRNLGLANVTIGERERSAVLMETGARQLVSAMKSFPDDAAILTKLGIALLRRGDNSDAAEVYEYALRLESDRASHHVNLATAYQQAGETNQAIRHLEQALELDRSLEIAYQRLGEIYIQQNDPARLRQTLERYLQFMPGHIGTQTALKQLEPQ
jgi:tetratricopeptide (TPR) repeat protein